MPVENMIHGKAELLPISRTSKMLPNSFSSEFWPDNLSNTALCENIQYQRKPHFFSLLLNFYLKNMGICGSMEKSQPMISWDHFYVYHRLEIRTAFHSWVFLVSLSIFDVNDWLIVWTVELIILSGSACQLSEKLMLGTWDGWAAWDALVRTCCCCWCCCCCLVRGRWPLADLCL